MSIPTEDGDETADGAPPAGAVDVDELLARIETLEGEVERLETELADARRTSYRRTAAGLAVLGGLALVGATLFAGVRTVLLALGGTGLFGALLVYYLTPERFVGASVAAGVYQALAANLEAIATELELADAAVYVPVDGTPPVRLYVPDQPPDVAGIPDGETLRTAFVVTPDHTGLSLRPTGGPLRAEFVEVTAPVPTDPADLAHATAEALVEQFELVDTADPDVGTARATVRITGSTYGPVDRLDHPVASFLASTFATTLDQPVELDVTPESEAGTYLITCRWDTLDA